VNSEPFTIEASSLGNPLAKLDVEGKIPGHGF
jgi:hypothetical protein